jgi:hypothetical protein
MSPTRSSKFLPFKTPLELAVFYDGDLRAGKYDLYPWQIDMLNEYSVELATDEIMNMGLIAANGSGKSKIIMAPCITWLATQFNEAQCTVTSASAHQLDTQTERYVNQIGNNINAFHRDDFGGEDIFKMVNRKKFFKPTGSFVNLFATDESGKAEGAHPLVFGGELGIFIDEGKSIDEEIYRAITRCTGLTRRVDISSPGGCHGHFYDVCTRNELTYCFTENGERKVINEGIRKAGWRIWKVTAWDCPHIRQTEIEQAIVKYGLHDPLVRSAFFAEFTSVDEQTVISYETLRSCMKIWAEAKAQRTEDDLKLLFGFHAGLDLAAGGDENVFSHWDGNIQIAQETARRKDTTQAVKEIIHWFEKHGYKQETANRIWADDGGVGRGIIDRLHELGWKINRVLNQHRAFDNTRYANRGTELWFNFKRFVEEGQVKLLPDTILHSQLSNRYYKQPYNNKLQLESKPEAKLNGHPSPDRADACILAWTNYTFPLDHEKAGIRKVARPDSVAGEALANIMRLRLRDKFMGKFKESPDKPFKPGVVITQSMIVNGMLKRDPNNDTLQRLEKKMRKNTYYAN